MNRSFLPNRGNYKTLLSYQKSVIIYDCTFLFCKRFLSYRDRTVDQMVQAARSGKQNIIEGSKAAVTSTETEIKLTNVARASLEELLEDYNDFLRVRELPLWDKDCKEASYVRNLSSGRIKPPTVGNSHNLIDTLRNTFVSFIENRPPDVCANIMICLIHQCNFLLDRQIKQLERTFTHKGGLRERMYNARKNYKQNRRGN